MAFVATTLPVKVGLAVLASHLALAAASVAVADMRSGATRRAATAPRVRANEMGLIFDFFCVVNLVSSGEIPSRRNRSVRAHYSSASKQSDLCVAVFRVIVAGRYLVCRFN